MDRQNLIPQKYGVIVVAVRAAERYPDRPSLQVWVGLGPSSRQSEFVAAREKRSLCYARRIGCSNAKCFRGICSSSESWYQLVVEDQEEGPAAACLAAIDFLVMPFLLEADVQSWATGVDQPTQLSSPPVAVHLRNLGSR